MRVITGVPYHDDRVHRRASQVNALFVAVKIAWGWAAWTEGGNWNWAGFVALLFGGIALSRNIVASTRLGQKSSFVFDCFCLTLAVQLGWLHSGYWWYLYLAIPGYGVYKAVRMLLDWVFTPTQSEMDENRELTPQELKRQKKAERRANRPRYRR